MARPIVKEDVQKIQKLVADVLGLDGPLDIERMGGLTNHTYKVRVETGKLYAIRIPGDGTEELIVRKDEKISTQLACDLGIDAKTLYFGDDGSKVAEYICNAVTMSAQTLKQPEQIKQVAQVFQKLHGCGVNTGVAFEVFDMAAGYEKIIEQNNVFLFDDYAQTKRQVMQIKQEIDRLCNPAKVPCHNDPLCENWILGDGKMYLIDWEYAGMNDPLWDLADVSIEAGYSREQEQELLQSYLNTPVLDNTEWKHFLANKIYVDYLWTLWAKTRVPYDGKPMEDWAEERYARLKENLTTYQSIQ